MLSEKEIKKLKVIACKMKSIAFFNTDDITLVNTFIDYFQKSNTDKIFDMLGVKVNEEFEVEIGNTLYNSKIDENLVYWYQGKASGTWFDDNEDILRELLIGKYKIIKLPPQSLLTNEEKEFLRNYEFDTISKRGEVLNALYKGNWYCIQLFKCKHKFNNFERDKEYTKQELGL